MPFARGCCGSPALERGSPCGGARNERIAVAFLRVRRNVGGVVGHRPNVRGNARRFVLRDRRSIVFKT